MIRSFLFAIAALLLGAFVTFDEAHAQGQQLYDEYGKPVYVYDLPRPAPPQYEGYVPGYINCPGGGRATRYELCAPYSTPSYGGYGYYGYNYAPPQYQRFYGRSANQNYTPNYDARPGYQQPQYSGRAANQGYTPDNNSGSSGYQQPQPQYSGRAANQDYTPSHYGGQQSRPEYRETERVSVSRDGERRTTTTRRRQRSD